MANVKISNLTAASTPLAGTEVLPIVQSGATVKASIANVQTAVYPGGTANGVAYLNGSKVLTTGSALVFDGSNLGLGVTPSAWGVYKAIDILSGGAVFGAATNYAGLGSNCFNNGSGWRYKNTAVAGLYQLETNTHVWYTAASGTAGNAITFTQAMTLDASGNLGIGTTSPAQKLDVYLGTTGTVGQYLRNTTINLLSKIDGTTAAQFGTETSHPLTFITGNTERARIDSSGNLLVGTTTALGTLTVNGTVSSSYTGFYIGEQTYRMQVASGQIQVIASSGGVYLPSGGTGWGSLSDENLKNITGLITNGIDAVKSLRAARYTWKSDETNKPQVGLIAQDIRAVLPEAVDENSDGFLGVRYSDVIPLLVAAIQEQQALITQLTARITALESA